MRVRFGNKKSRILLWVVIAFILVLGFLILIHPLLVYVIPSIEHSGVELYTSGTYLKYDKGDTFQKLVAELSFVEYGEVNSFSYHDSVLRDNWWLSGYSDAFILELDMEENYALAIQEMETKEGWAIARDPAVGYVYRAAESGQGDFLFVIVFEKTQKVVCLLITDADSWSTARTQWLRYFSVPGDPGPLPIEKSQSN